MRSWRVIFCVTWCFLNLVCSQPQNVQKRSIDDFTQNTNEIPATSSQPEGRGLWDRFSSIFRSVYDYFGFSKAPERASRGSSVVRRPEMLPFQLQNAKKRRSGLEAPNGYPDQFNQFPESHSKIRSQKQKLQMQRNPLEVSHKLEPPAFSGDEPSLRFDQINRRHPTNEKKSSNFMVVHVKDGIQQDHSRKPPKASFNQQPSFEVAKVESREPLVSVYNKGIPTTKKSPPKAIQKLQPSSSVHSKFSLDKYSKAKENPYWDDPIITNSKGSNAFIVTSSFSHGKKENGPTSGTLAASTIQDRKPVSQNRKHISKTTNTNSPENIYLLQKQTPNVHERTANSQEWNPALNKNQNDQEKNPNLVRKQRFRNHYERDTRDTLKTQEQDMNPFFATVPREEIPASKRNEKRKGLIGSMTNFASNFFSNFLPKAPTASPFPGNGLNPPPPQAFHSLPSSNHESIEKRSPQINPQINSQINPHLPQPQKAGSSNRNRFAPSPLQGSMKVDSFQPIFVPSPSLDSKLPHDAMKPMIIPQKRNILTTEAPSAPKLIDFF